jgi:hypothetical protein
MCRRAEILSPQLAQYLRLAAQSCHSCLRTSRPKPSNKIKFHSQTTENLLTPYRSIFSIWTVSTGDPSFMLWMDTRTSFSMARLCQNRDLELLESTFGREWVHVHEPSAEVSGDREFAQDYFQDMLRRHNIAFREQGARRHDKTGAYERGNGILKNFIKRLVLDIQSKVAGFEAIIFTVPEIVRQATYSRIYLWSTRFFRP